MFRERGRFIVRDTVGSDPTLALDLNFLSETFPSSLTITRASSATDIINGTLTSFSSNQARVSVANGLLVEPARTNLAINNTSAEQGNLASFTQGASDPLEGSLAFTATSDSGSLLKNWNCTPTSIAFVSGTTYTVSAFVKAGTSDRVQMYIPTTVATAGTTYANFYLNGAGSVSASGAGALRTGITALNNGWYRINFSFAANATSTQTVLWAFLSSGSEGFAPTVSGSSTTLLYYGPQVEAGTNLTSYIPTTTATATRATDVITGPMSWVDATKGTIVCRAKSNKVDTSSITDNVVWALQGAGGYQIKVDKTYGSCRGFVQNNYVSQAAMTNTWAVDSLVTHGLAWEANNFAWKFDGQVLQTDGVGVIPAVTDFRIGNSTATTNSFDGYIHSVKCYNVRKTDAELTALVV